MNPMDAINLQEWTTKTELIEKILSKKHAMNCMLEKSALLTRMPGYVPFEVVDSQTIKIYDNLVKIYIENALSECWESACPEYVEVFTKYKGFKNYINSFNSTFLYPTSNNEAFCIFLSINNKKGEDVWHDLNSEMIKINLYLKPEIAFERQWCGEATVKRTHYNEVSEDYKKFYKAYDMLMNIINKFPKYKNVSDFYDKILDNRLKIDFYSIEGETTIYLSVDDGMIEKLTIFPTSVIENEDLLYSKVYDAYMLAVLIFDDLFGKDGHTLSIDIERKISQLAQSIKNEA